MKKQSTNLDLFSSDLEKVLPNAPLADRMRPQSLSEIVGQEKILGPGCVLDVSVKLGRLPSMVFWGPPGTGKTTTAHLVAKAMQAELIAISAVLSGVKDLREAIEKADYILQRQQKPTILFVDEIHRFNKAQQDALLPHVESGLVTLIGATTENPSFEVIAALLSRCRVYVFEPLRSEDIILLLQRALCDSTRGLAPLSMQINNTILEIIAKASYGDARSAYNTLEVAVRIGIQKQVSALEKGHIEQALQHRVLYYDKKGEAHYDVVSAFIKSMRGSDPDAALYWMARMLEGGEAPRFILRRLVIFASEDIGNADPNALGVAIAALQAFEFVGLPEAKLNLAQAVTYLATAPKSNASYLALKMAVRDVKEYGPLPVPLHLRNAPTALMKGLGYGKDYQYPHDQDEHFSEKATYLPDELGSQIYYQASSQGYEKRIAERLEHWRKLRIQR